jgi:hypothetical protein
MISSEIDSLSERKGEEADYHQQEGKEAELKPRDQTRRDGAYVMVSGEHLGMVGVCLFALSAWDDDVNGLQTKNRGENKSRTLYYISFL